MTIAWRYSTELCPTQSLASSVLVQCLPSLSPLSYKPVQSQFSLRTAQRKPLLHVC